ncbi:MAG: hypothetical protein E7649_04755 [Ruminococcaceae bacterium]|nr:hypothetical protein [Oscillospiraceae bacterium]
MGFTPNQQSAIDVRDRTLLVSAAAGSGKTFTLTQRIIRSIIDDGQDLSRLLIVTFTKAAASELKAKIARAVSEAISENPQNPRLQEQLIRLGSANISTIDSFFMEPVRSSFEKLGLPASIRMADEAELLPLKERIMREAVDEMFEKCEAYRDGGLSRVGYHDKYTDLIGIIAETRSAARIIPTLCDIYSKLLTSPEGIEQINKHAERLRSGAELEFFDTLEGGIVKRELIETAEYGAATLSMWKERLELCPDVPINMVQLFDSNATSFIALAEKLKASDYEAAKSAISGLDLGRLYLKKGEYPDVINDAKKARKTASDAMSSIYSKYLSLSSDELKKCLLTYSEMAYVIYDVIKSFDERYRQEKLARGVCEFSDMPIFMLRLLLDENGEPTEYARELSSRFDAVYIDEYQDVNEIQDKIFSIIGRDRRFMVGDIKQSIYGFREAEPSIFAQYRREFSTYDKQNDSPPAKGGGNTIFMSENFRCDENVVKFTNLICSGIFSAFAQSIGYTNDDDLRFAKGRPFQDYQSPKTVISLVHSPKYTQNYDTADSAVISAEMKSDEKAKSSASLADEAIVVANQIADLLRTQRNANGTPVRAGDIAVLVRSSANARPLMSALSKLRIKYALSSKTELFETDEMKLLVSLLEAIDNPRYDTSMCHLLTARTDQFKAFFSYQEVVTMRHEADAELSLFDALLKYANDGNDATLRARARDFALLMDKMRTEAGKLSADKLVKGLIFSPVFSGLATSSAYTFLYDCVCKYVKSNWNSLHSFLTYFKDLMENGSVGGEPDKSKNDAVSIMTIHQSKGLEFNVCFLFGFGKQFNLSNRYPLLFNKDFGITMKLPPNRQDEAPIIERIKTRHEETPIWKIVCDSVKKKQIEEEARVFYVALTRARERLYISASISGDYEDLQKKLSSSADYVYDVKKGNSYINWILLTLMRSEDRDSYTIDLYTKSYNELTRPFKWDYSVERSINSDDFEEEFAELYNTRSSITDAEKSISLIPSKIAASKVKPDMLDTSIFIPIPTGKLFSDSDEDAYEPEGDDAKQIKARIELMRSQKTDFDSLLRAGERPTAAERGTAMHQFLQFCDYDNVERLGVAKEIQRLREQRFISERSASMLDIGKLEAFFKSSLFSSIKTALCVHREFHFRMFRPVSDFTKNQKLIDLAANKSILIQGSIDLVVETADGRLILCDYKTDRVTKEEFKDRSLLINNMKARHGEQLNQYRSAVEQIFGKAPDKIYLFLLSIGDCIEV